MKRSAVKLDLFAADHHRARVDALGDPLAFLARHADFALLAAEVDRAAPRPQSRAGGRPPYPTEVMVRLLVLKRLHNLSDEQAEYQLADRMSFRRFCGLEHSASLPDRNTLWQFENRIGAEGARAVFEAVRRQCERQGFIPRAGQIVDATLVPAPRQHVTQEEKAILAEDATPPGWSPAQRRQRDTDASWTVKHGRSHYGYKLSVSVDKRYKLIRRLATGTAAVHDSRHFEAVLDVTNTSVDVYADRGYASAAREAALRQAGYRVHIQRKGQRGQPLSACQRRRNRRIAPLRARVEHVFGAIRQMGGKLIRTMGQARADFAMTMMAACYNLRRFAWLREQPAPA